MMRFLKNNLKFFIGVAVLLMAVFVFFQAQKSTDLETGCLKDWRAASWERRQAAAKLLIANDENTDLLVACVDKMATLPDARSMTVRDGIELCYMGIKLKNNDSQTVEKDE